MSVGHDDALKLEFWNFMEVQRQTKMNVVPFENLSDYWLSVGENGNFSFILNYVVSWKQQYNIKIAKTKCQLQIKSQK
jgi:hypothetical protein